VIVGTTLVSSLSFTSLIVHGDHAVICRDGDLFGGVSSAISPPIQRVATSSIGPGVWPLTLNPLASVTNAFDWYGVYAVGNGVTTLKWSPATHIEAMVGPIQGFVLVVLETPARCGAIAPKGQVTALRNGQVIGSRRVDPMPGQVSLIPGC
jgi:hypothetical protein